jgi:hypothetical protein
MNQTKIVTFTLQPIAGPDFETSLVSVLSQTTETVRRDIVMPLAMSAIVTVLQAVKDALIHILKPERTFLSSVLS